MKELARVQGEQHLYRDEESGAIINNDSETLAIYKKRKTVFQKQINEINTLREEMKEIKNILRNLTNGQNS
jgi:CRISPR/Cas system CMR-associated protein Cmr3 (group 5 of RAMP superfamily)